MERRVISGQPPPLEPSEQAIALERLDTVGPVFSHNGLLFALSFEPGRDGVHARCGGRESYLTADDLRIGAGYRPLSIGFIELGERLERARVLELLSRSLPCSPSELAAHAQLERFSSTRMVVGAAPAPAAPPTPTANDLASELYRSAAFLAGLVNEEGLLLVSEAGHRTPDWQLQGHVISVLSGTAHLLDAPKLRVVALRAARRMEEERLQCGLGHCATPFSAADAASELEAQAALARTVMAQAFVHDMRELRVLLRSEQLPDGTFPAGVEHRPDGASRATGDLATTAEVVVALTSGYDLERDAGDLEAIARGAGALVRARPERLLGANDSAAICFSLMKAARHARAVEGALSACQSWSLARSRFQVSASDSTFAGGVRPSALGLPSTSSSAGAARALLATSAVLLQDPRHDERTLTALLDTSASALTFLARQELPGDRSELVESVPPGAFSEGPLAEQLSVAATERSASALLDYLTLVKERDPIKAKKKPKPPIALQ